MSGGIVCLVVLYVWCIVGLVYCRPGGIVGLVYSRSGDIVALVYCRPGGIVGLAVVLAWWYCRSGVL